MPPPYAGPEVASEILLQNIPQELINIYHIKSNIRDENWKKGKFDLYGLILTQKIILKVIDCLIRKDIEKTYFLLSSSKIGFLRDSVYVLISYLFRKKIILHYRGGNFDGFYDKCNPLFKYYIKFILRISDLIIVQAEILKKMFLGITETKLKVLYNGLVVKENKTKKIFNKEETVLLFMGHIAFSKGFYELIRVYKRLFKKHSLKLLFAGTFRFEKEKSKTQRAFLNGKVLEYYENHSAEISAEINEFICNSEKYNSHYLGIVSGKEKENAFGGADILILPSYTEGFSFTVLEGLSDGLPVIVSNVGALPEIIKENYNGWIVEAGNEKSIEDKITFAVSNKEGFGAISNNNKQYFRDNFDVKIISRQFEKILYEA